MHKERPSFSCFLQISITSNAAIEESGKEEENAEFATDIQVANAFAGIVAINGQMSSPGAEGGPAASGRRPARQRGAGASGFGLREPRPRNPSCAAIWGGGGGGGPLRLGLDRKPSSCLELEKLLLGASSRSLTRRGALRF
jgi:hypothetical protein